MESLEIRSTLNQIKDMASNMASTPEDHRIVAFRSVDPLFLKLEGHLRECPDEPASSILDEIKMKVIIMAGLEDANEDSDADHVRKVDSLVDELGRILCT